MSERVTIPFTCARCGLADATVQNTKVYAGCSTSSPTAFYEIHPLHPQGEDGERDTCLDAMRERLTAAERERDEARREREDEGHIADHIINAHGKLLTEIANAIHGEPEPLSMHSHHDLPELVNALVRDLDAARREREEALDQLAAAHDAREKASVECSRIVADINERLIESRHRAEQAERERDTAVETAQLAVARADEFEREHRSVTSEYMKMRHRVERMERRVVEAAEAFGVDPWRGDLEGTVVGVSMEYDANGTYVLYEDVLPIIEAVRALRTARGDA